MQLAMFFLPSDMTITQTTRTANHRIMNLPNHKGSMVVAPKYEPVASKLFEHLSSRI